MPFGVGQLRYSMYRRDRPALGSVATVGARAARVGVRGCGSFAFLSSISILGREAPHFSIFFLKSRNSMDGGEKRWQYERPKLNRKFIFFFLLS